MFIYTLYATLGMKQVLKYYYDEGQSRAPQCSEKRHRWSIDVGTQDNGDGSLVFHDECEHCHSRRRRRRSYLSIASPDIPTGDGRDWTLYYEATPDYGDDDDY